MKKICRQCAEEVSLLLGERDAVIEELRSELKRRKRSMAEWQQMGCLRSGEAVYCRQGGVIAVEKDHEFLVVPNREELDEIIEMA